MNKSRVIFNNAEVNVYFTYDEGQVGSCDSYGAKYEPDYPSSIDIDEVFYQGVNICLINAKKLTTRLCTFFGSSFVIC